MATIRRKSPEIVIKRVYEEMTVEDGYRVLVDRLWPRGIKKEAAHVDLWAKELAPSTELRKWFNHEEAKFAEFRQKYLAELAGKHDTILEMFSSASGKQITLLYAASNVACNHALVLRDFLSGLVKSL